MNERFLANTWILALSRWEICLWWKHLTYCCQFSCPTALAPSPASVSEDWGWALGGSSADTLQGTEGCYEANMLRMLPRSAVTHCAVRESWFYCLEFVLIKMNTNKSLELWQLISTEPTRLSWRQICLGVSAWLCCWHKKLLLLVEDDAIVCRNCCCSGLKCK